MKLVTLLATLIVAVLVATSANAGSAHSANANGGTCKSGKQVSNLHNCKENGGHM